MIDYKEKMAKRRVLSLIILKSKVKKQQLQIIKERKNENYIFNVDVISIWMLR